MPDVGAKPPQPGRQGQRSPAGEGYNPAQTGYNPTPIGYGYNPSQQQPASQSRLIDAMAERSLPPEKRKSPPPTLANAFIKGVFEFPFYISGLGCLIGTSCGLSFSFLVMVFALDQGFSVGAAVRPLGQSAMMAFILTMGFAIAHCRSIVEETAYGADEIENWPPFDWKGWILTFFFAAIVLAEALAAAYVLAVPRLMGSPLPWLVITFLLYPVLLLSALENDSPFVPIAMPVLKSFKTLWWAWWLFYVETALLIVFWLAVTFVGMFVLRQPYLTVFVSGPLLAAVLMIYARLLGRLIWCASQEEESDDDD
jgi:hypothetical protein